MLTLCVLYIWRKSTVVYSFRTKLEYEFAKYGAWCISCQNAAHTTCFDIQSTVGDRAFPINGYLRILHVLPLHVTSAPALQTFRRRGWSHFCSVVVSRPIFSFHIIAATLLLAVAVGATHVKATGLSLYRYVLSVSWHRRRNVSIGSSAYDAPTAIRLANVGLFDEALPEASCHRGTWGTCPQTVLRLWLIVYRTELTVSLCA